MVKSIVGSMSDWSGTLKDLFRQIDDGSVSLVNLQAFLEHRNPFDTLPDINWQKVYETLGMSAEYEEAVKTLGVKEDTNLWIVPVIKGVTCNKVVVALRKLGVDVFTYADDLDKGVPINDRDPNRDGSYIIGFRRTVGADEENKNLSAKQLKERNHKGITLLERFLLELGYFLTTGQHLDVKNISLCAGSRAVRGNVPYVYWHPDYRRVYVCWYDPGGSGGGLRSRSAVSLPA